MALAFPTDSTIRFLHHSTGGIIWNGGVATWVSNYNSAHGTSYAISQANFPDTGGGYPWANYPYDYWNIWVNHAGPTQYMGEDTLEILTQLYDVIVLKHCFPVSDMVADTGNPDVTSSVKSAENYKLQYAALKTKLNSFTENRFLVWTGAALRAVDTTEAAAQRAHDFFDWVKNEWDDPNDNIYLWDFWEYETEGGLYLLPEHSNGVDSHPGTAFAAEVSPIFGQRTVDVILGTGDGCHRAAHKRFAKRMLP